MLMLLFNIRTYILNQKALFGSVHLSSHLVSEVKENLASLTIILIGQSILFFSREIKKKAPYTFPIEFQFKE